MRYRNILFDMDGTLVDTTEGVLNCFAHAMREMGLPPMLREKMNCFMGPPLSYSFTEFCNLSEEDTVKAIAIYRERYARKGQYECALFPGITEILTALKKRGVRLCVATSKLEIYARSIANHLGIASYFDEIVGSNASETISTKDEVIAEAFRRMQIRETDSVLMVGDRKYDIEGAKKRGVDSLGVYMGCAEDGEMENAGATYIAHGVEEMQKILLSL